MVSANKNFVAAYLILVIIPILGLIGVLRSENKLVAPTAIGGLWKTQGNAQNLAAWPCARSVATMRDVGFTISQSGKYFTLNFANSAAPSASGFIERTTVKIKLLPSAEWFKEMECSGGNVFSLIATLDSEVNPSSMAGFLSVDNCAVCSPAEFRAFREK